MNYPGGKGGVYQRLINAMPPHEVFIESYLGGGAVMRYKRPALHNIGIEIDPKTIKMWDDFNKFDFELIQTNAVTYLQKYPFTGKELIYCDPPYLRETRKKYYPLYKYEYTYDQHVELLELIKTLPCMVMISGYKSDLYSDLLKDWHTYSFQAACHYGVATEYVWMNYPHPDKLHDYRYLGDNFRERERIKCKTKSWVRRFKTMPTLEQQVMLDALFNSCATKEVFSYES